MRRASGTAPQIGPPVAAVGGATPMRARPGRPPSPVTGRGSVGATTRLVLLGAGRPARGTLPSALVRTGPRRRILDWLLDAFAELAVDHVSFVGGYRFEQISREYPDLDVAINKDWRSTGPVGSLMTIPLEAGCTAYVSYTDVVYTRDSPLRLDAAGGDVVLAIDPDWRRRFAGRPLVDLKRAEKVQLSGDGVVRVGARVPLGEASGEFMGLVKLGPCASERLTELYGEPRRAWARSSLPELIQRFVDDGLDVRAAELPGRWAELNAPQDLARFVLGTKASTLLRLQSLVKRSTVPLSLSFAADDWESEPDEVLGRIAATFAADQVIVRSSSAREDSWTASNAGAFVSIGSVTPADRGSVAAAVEAVLDSYAPRTPGDEVLVQEVVHDVAAAGVVMTRSPKTGAPYFVVNLDDVSGRTDAVTAGASGHKTAFVHRQDADALTLDPALASAVEMAAEVEQLVGHDSLDLEFAVTRDQRVMLLQARPIVSDYRDWRVTDEDVAAALEEAELDLDRIAEATPFVLGDSFCLGVMPDWNPAEIVGVKPRRLALSLYQHLITDDVWARQRAEFGYRDVRPCPLVVTLAGQPFVDVRASFNSFVPAALPDAVARDIVNHYLDRLHERPELHDKVEFEIALTCKAFDFDDRAAAFLGDALSPSDLALIDDCLTRLTLAAVSRLDDHVAACRDLRARAELVAMSVADPLDRAFLLLEDCRRIGTLAFAHLARDAFIAVEWLRSLVRRGALDQDPVDGFLASLHTVSSDFSDDVERLQAGALTWDDFLGRYGHLRPGTYEITSPCYAEGIDHYLDLRERQGPGVSASRDRFQWSGRHRRAIERCLREAGLAIDFASFERFLRIAIEQREGSKFTFTRNLSDGLEDLALFGDRVGLTREELSHVRIEELLRLRRGSDAAVADTLAALAEEGERAYRRTLAVELPTLVFGHGELRAFQQSEVAANFVTTKSVRAPVVMIGNGALPERSLEGAIAVIGSADPGYDWLFTRGIAGLVTAFGGVNSHMAIRAAEQALPAAIGVGVRQHERLAQAQVVELNCAARTLRVVV